MNITVPIFERRVGRRLTWTTLALGSFNLAREGSHATKVRERLVRDLRRSLVTAEPSALEQLCAPRGLDLRRVRLELALRGGGKKRTVSGQFPLIVEPRWTTADQQLLVVYHPDLQDHWFVCRDADSLAGNAQRFLQHLWRDTPDHAFEALRWDGRGGLRSIALSVEPPTLLGVVERKRKKKEAERAGIAGLGDRTRAGAMKVLPQIARNLSRAAADAALDGGRPRPGYREQLQQLVGGRRRRSAILVGPPGVGRTTLIHRWVHDQLAADGYATHHNLDKCTQAWALSGRRLIAGMSFVGQWEQRCVEILEDAAKGPVVLVIDDLHAFGQIGRTRQSDRCLADFFRGPVARGELTILAECTPEQLARLESEAPTFAAAFATLTVNEASVSDTLAMMLHETRDLEDRYPVSFSPWALRAVLEVGRTLLSHAAFPGKALELIRSLAHAHEGAKERQELTSTHVTAHVSSQTGVPPLLLEAATPLPPSRVLADLERHVMGQTEATSAAVDIVMTIKAGLVDPRRPCCVALFTGPTGTGKTELAKSLAAYLFGSEDRLIRFDMSEYAQPDAPARLIGDRWEPEGQLTKRVRHQPFAVVLLDEIEKAHPSVLNLLLQLFDEGRLTDANGQVADFTHTVIVMTSNLGARSKSQVGFGESTEAILAHVASAVRKFFPPELFNRIDRVVRFRPLEAAAAHAIARKELDKLLTRRGLVERSILVVVNDSVIARVADEGFEARDGARSLKRYLERTVGQLLSEEIAGSERAAMRILRLYAAKEGGLELQTEALREAEPLARESQLAPLLSRSGEELCAELPAAIAFVDGMSKGPGLQHLADRIREHLAGYRIGQSGLADRIYAIDSLRLQLDELHQALTTQLEVKTPDEAEWHEVDQFKRVELRGEGRWDPAVRMRLVDPRWYAFQERQLGVEGLLGLLAETRFLERAAARVDEPDRHAAFVELLRIGSPPRRQRFGASPTELIEWLAETYQRMRGEVEATARRADHSGAQHIVIKLAGLCVLDALQGEQGVHIRQEGVGGAPEVVRVRIRPAGPDTSPEEVLEAHEAARDVFAAALEAGAELPDNPEALDPIVRRYRWDGPPKTASGGMGPPTPCDIEDYALSYVGSRRIRALSEVITPLRWLHLASPSADQSGRSGPSPTDDEVTS